MNDLQDKCRNRRAPGTTCMSALQSISMLNSAPVVNNSKGCGGAARAALNKKCAKISHQR